MFSGDLQVLVDDLAERLGRSATIEDDNHRVIVYSSQQHQIDDVRRDSILQRRTSPEVRTWFRKFGIVSCNDPVRIPPDRARGILGRLCIPVRHRDRLDGFLWLIDDDESLTAPQVTVAETTARHAAILMHEEMLAERLASTALAHLLVQSEEVRTLAAAQVVDDGIVPAGSPVVVSVLVPESTDAGTRTLIGDCIRDVSRLHVRGEVLGVAHADHGAVLTFAPGGDRAGHAMRIARELRDCMRRRTGDVRTVVGIGEVKERLVDAQVSYRQARLSARAATRLPGVGDIAAWSALGALRAVVQLPIEAMVDSIDPRMAALFAAGDDRILDTLECYLDGGCDAQVTAGKLHLHRGTLYYRLQKAQEAADIDLRNGEDRLSAHVGFKLARLAGRYPLQA
ncbi:MAG TPA: helix-turn-helix domain-containing protein [Mycobacteriales bacterium]|jgi:hypothetical protein